MEKYKKYYLLFIIESLLFMGILAVIDWMMSEMNTWYTYVLQGILFGIFMTVYTYWSDKRKKSEDKE